MQGQVVSEPGEALINLLVKAMSVTENLSATAAIEIPLIQERLLNADYNCSYK